jgi:glycosyltransferase involved in cell wall biosynthesis
MSDGRPLRVAVDARLVEGTAGGIEQYVVGLAAGLSRLEGPERYLFLALPGHEGWIAQHLGGPCELLLAAAPSTPLRRFVRRRLGAVARAGDAARTAVLRARLARGAGVDAVPGSDGTVERAGADVVHFTTQQGFTTAIPTIYQPWDLQHLHLPQFFSREEYALRELRYRRLCEQAALVAVASEASRRDVVEHYGIPAGRVAVVPAAAPTVAFRAPAPAEIEAARRRLGLPEAFAYYPARTWPHKNHLLLLDALARLRDDRDLVVPLVCSGRLDEHYAAIAARVRGLRLEEQVRFVGQVDAADVRCLYALARIVVLPSLFEGWGLPLTEAFEAGVPVASSTAAALAEQAGDAALLFDPGDVGAAAAAIARLWGDGELRRELAARGRRRIESLDWTATAAAFRDHYRRIAGCG